MSLSRGLAIAGTVGSLLIFQAFPAHAANPTPQQIKAAAEAFDRGIKAAQAGQFDEAASHFEEADREAPSPDALRAAVRARRDAKQGARASTLAALALGRYPDDKDLGSFARGVIEQFGAGLHKVSVSCKPECVLVVDNKLIPGEAASSITLYLDPGKHGVSAGWNDKTQSRDMTATAGGSSSLSFSPPKDDKPAPAASSAPSAAPAPSATEGDGKKPAPRGGLPPVVTYVGVGVTVLLAGVSVWSGLDTQSNPGPDKVKELCVGQGEGCSAYQDGLSRQKRTNMLLAATGGAAVVTGVLALLTNWKGDAPASSAARAPKKFQISPGIGFDSSGAAFYAAGRFLCPLPSSSTRQRPPGSIATS